MQCVKLGRGTGSSIKVSDKLTKIPDEDTDGVGHHYKCNLQMVGIEEAYQQYNTKLRESASLWNPRAVCPKANEWNRPFSDWEGLVRRSSQNRACCTSIRP